MLNLCYCTQITDAGLKHLGTLEELTNLEMRCLVRITGIGITSIAIGCTSLIELDLKRCYSVDDAGLWALSRYSQNLRQVRTHKLIWLCLLLVFRMQSTAQHCVYRSVCSLPYRTAKLLAWACAICSAPWGASRTWRWFTSPGSPLKGLRCLYELLVGGSRNWSC